MKNFNFSELTIEKAAQWPGYIKYLVVLLVIMLVLSWGYWLVIRTQVDQVVKLAAQEKTLKLMFEQKQQQAINLIAYQHQLQRTKNRFDHLLKKFSKQHEKSLLLEKLSQLALSCGLSIDLFTPQPEIAHDFYREWPINLIIRGTYHQLANFLSRIAQLPQIITIEILVLSMNKREKNKSALSSNLLEMKMTANIIGLRHDD